MQVTLNLDAAQMGETVVDVFKSLTQEQKQELARQVVREWLGEPAPPAADLDARAIEHCRRNVTSDHWGHQRKYEHWNAGDIRGTPEYREYVAKQGPPAAAAVELFRKQVLQHVHDAVSEFVRNDPQCRAAAAAVCGVVQEMFPQVAHDALTLYCAASLDRAAQYAVGNCMQVFQSSRDGTGQVAELKPLLSEKIAAAVKAAGLADVAPNQ